LKDVLQEITLILTGEIFNKKSKALTGPDLSGFKNSKKSKQIVFFLQCVPNRPQ
jgi:hypothetical protein